MTDTASDLTVEYARKHDIHILPLKVFSGEQEIVGYAPMTDDSWIKEFYARLRSKETITTSCPTAFEFDALFAGLLEAGQDVVYIGFSTWLSATFGYGSEVVETLKAKYPEREIYAIDSLCASLGQGLFVDYAVRMRTEGRSAKDVTRWLEDNKQHLCHWFTVDDLFFLKRGGRINAATAIAGTVLGIKPVLHVDDEGHLINVGKAHGRRQALKTLVDHMEETATKPGKQRVFISHGDCLDDALYVKKLIEERFGTREFEIGYITPVIGAHAGPGTVALFFFGSHR